MGVLNNTVLGGFDLLGIEPAKEVHAVNTTLYKKMGLAVWVQVQLRVAAVKCLSTVCVLRLYGMLASFGTMAIRLSWGCWQWLHNGYWMRLPLYEWAPSLYGISFDWRGLSIILEYLGNTDIGYLAFGAAAALGVISVFFGVFASKFDEARIRWFREISVAKNIT